MNFDALKNFLFLTMEMPPNPEQGKLLKCVVMEQGGSDQRAIWIHSFDEKTRHLRLVFHTVSIDHEKKTITSNFGETLVDPEDWLYCVPQLLETRDDIVQKTQAEYDKHKEEGIFGMIDRILDPTPP